MLPISRIAVYGYIITFIGGEVKSPRTNIFKAQILNAAICIAFLLWVGLAYQRMVGWEGIHALAWIDEEIFHIYSNPFYDELVAREVTFPFIKEMVAKS